jgi:hypothetical protein
VQRLDIHLLCSGVLPMGPAPIGSQELGLHCRYILSKRTTLFTSVGSPWTTGYDFGIHQSF